MHVLQETTKTIKTPAYVPEAMSVECRRVGSSEAPSLVIGRRLPLPTTAPSLMITPVTVTWTVA